MNPVHHALTLFHTPPIRATRIHVSPAPPTTKDDPDKAAFVAAVEEYFSFTDTDNSGTISLDEFKAFIARDSEGDAARDADQAKEMLKDFDTNEDGTVTKEEYLAYMMTSVEDADASYAEAAEYYTKSLAEFKEKAEAKVEDKAAFVAAVDEYFSFMDTDNSGTISLDEVKAFILKKSGAVDEDEAEGMMKDLDTNEDGTVTKEEFLALLGSHVEDDDYAEAAKGWSEFVAELKEKTEAKAEDGGKKSQGRERGGVRSGCKEGGSE